VKPEDVWREMERREDLLGIAEKLPKSAVKMPKVLARKAVADKALPKATASPAVRRRIVALEGRSLRKRH
jgi:phosphoribosyl-ATP pyrophosphohydrolase